MTGGLAIACFSIQGILLIVLISAIFLKKKVLKHSDPKSGQRGVVLVIQIPGKKVSRMPFWLTSF
jgi:hypothetical protein